MTAQRIVPPETAFRLSHGRRRPRVEDRKHLDFIRGLPCLITGRRDGVEAAHIRYADPVYGKRSVGKGEKPDDRWTVPLHWEKHREQHGVDEEAFWEHYGIDPVRVALSLHQATGDDDAAELILRTARDKTKVPGT